MPVPILELFCVVKVFSMKPRLFRIKLQIQLSKKKNTVKKVSIGFFLA
jgi:hypothetical protein